MPYPSKYASIETSSAFYFIQQITFLLDLSKIADEIDRFNVQLNFLSKFSQSETQTGAKYSKFKVQFDSNSGPNF